MLYWFLPYNNEKSAIICLLSLPPPSTIPPLQVITKHQAVKSVLYSTFSLAVYFTHGSVYMSMLLSQFISPSPSLIGSTSVFYTSVSPFLPCKNVHQYSRFHIYTLYTIFVFLFMTYFTLYNRLQAQRVSSQRYPMSPSLNFSCSLYVSSWDWGDRELPLFNIYKFFSYLPVAINIQK